MRRHSLGWIPLGIVMLADSLAAQGVEQSALPVIAISRPTVIAFWKVPVSDSELVADPDLASALDQQQYYWAETRERLTRLGIAALDQPGRRFRMRDHEGERVFISPPDSAVVGYLLVAPGEAYRVVYRLHYPDDLIALATKFFGLPPP